jgi:hypothetical protein
MTRIVGLRTYLLNRGLGYSRRLCLCWAFEDMMWAARRALGEKTLRRILKEKRHAKE